MSEPVRTHDDSVAPPLPPIPLIVMGVGALLAIAVLGQAKAGGSWAIGGCLAGAILLGSSLVGRLAVWFVRVHEVRDRRDADRLQAMDRIAERLGRIVDQLQDAALDLETSPTSSPSSTPAPELDEPPPLPVEPLAVSAPVVPSLSPSLVEFRGLLREHRWDEAEAIADEHAESSPDDPEALHRELAAARFRRAESLHAELQAAREVQDADRVIDLRDELLLHLTLDEQAGLNRDLAAWLLHLVQRRCLTGKVAADVVSLAERVAMVFADTREGASLRASLPTLRRCAGLCPRCSRPYNGEESACPRCLVTATPSPSWPADDDEDSPTEPGTTSHGSQPNGHSTAPGHPGNGESGT